MSCRDNAPKSTSVPSCAQPSATGSGEVALRCHQWQPPGELVAVGDELHRREQRIVDQRVVTTFQEVDVGCAVREADVRDGVEKTAHVGQEVVLYGVRPELPRHLELLVDLNRFADVDRAVGPRRRVVQLA